MTTLTQLPDTQTLAEICRRFHVRRIFLFGSASRGELREESDVDLLAEFDANYPVTYFTLVEMSDELRPLFGGRQVDLMTEGSVHPIIRKRIRDDLSLLYLEA